MQIHIWSRHKTYCRITIRRPLFGLFCSELRIDNVQRSIEETSLSEQCVQQYIR